MIGGDSSGGVNYRKAVKLSSDSLQMAAILTNLHFFFCLVLHTLGCWTQQICFILLGVFPLLLAPYIKDFSLPIMSNAIPLAPDTQSYKDFSDKSVQASRSQHEKTKDTNIKAQTSFFMFLLVLNIIPVSLFGSFFTVFDWNWQIKMLLIIFFQWTVFLCAFDNPIYAQYICLSVCVCDCMLIIDHKQGTSPCLTCLTNQLGASEHTHTQSWRRFSRCHFPQWW